eukprot:g22395.t1
MASRPSWSVCTALEFQASIPCIDQGLNPPLPTTERGASCYVFKQIFLLWQGSERMFGDPHAETSSCVPFENSVIRERRERQADTHSIIVFDRSSRQPPEPVFSTTKHGKIPGPQKLRLGRSPRPEKQICHVPVELKTSMRSRPLVGLFIERLDLGVREVWLGSGGLSGDLSNTMGVRLPRKLSVLSEAPHDSEFLLQLFFFPFPFSNRKQQHCLSWQAKTFALPCLTSIIVDMIAPIVNIGKKTASNNFYYFFKP